VIHHHHILFCDAIALIVRDNVCLPKSKTQQQQQQHQQQQQQQQLNEEKA
jgi:hypothetical protein